MHTRITAAMNSALNFRLLVIWFTTSSESLLSFRRLGRSDHRGYGAARDLELDVIGLYSKDQLIILNADDGSHDASGGEDLDAALERGQLPGMLLILLPLGH